MVLGFRKFPSCRGVPAGRGGIALCFALLLFGCAELERNRFYEGDNYGYTGSYGSVEHDGKTYKTVQIGFRTWMAENLNYNAPGSKCYDNLDSNCDKYGRLYNWATAKTACPSGWHLPSKVEWEAMTAFIGGANTEGMKLKSTSGWNSGGNGTDEYGFSALPGGYGYSVDLFDFVGYGGYWWSSSEDGSDSAYDRVMFYDDRSAHWFDDGKSFLYSVRCVED